MRKRKIYLRHTAVDGKIGAIDETAFIAREEKDSLGLLDGFAEAAGWEVDLAAMALFGVIAEPVLQ